MKYPHRKPIVRNKKWNYYDVRDAQGRWTKVIMWDKPLKVLFKYWDLDVLKRRVSDLEMTYYINGQRFTGVI